jgi:AraC-like DNA-binding protein
VKPLLRELTQKTAKRYPQLTFHIGVSHFTNHLDQLSARYQDALGMAQWADFAEKERLCFFTETPHPPLQTDAPDELREALRQRKPSSARRVIILLTRKISAMDYCDPSAVRQLYERLLVLCLNTEGGAGTPDVNQYTRMGLLGAFSKLRTLGELMRFLLSRIDSMFPELRMPDNVHPKIAQAILYIRENIASHTLSIAEHLDITDNYLCSLFKKETGTTVNHAIIDARMERAKRLMMSGDRMYEVADKVGFADPNYFSAVFRKHVGVPPTQYRRDRQGKAAGEEAFHETGF